MDDVSIAVCTYGDDAWIELAHHRALPSARQFGVPVLHVHGDSLDDARNRALFLCDTDHIVYLDADDELEPGYLDAMATSNAELRAPAVRYIAGRGVARASMPRVVGHSHDCTAECLAFGNWLVIGTCAPRRLLLEVGGWRDFPCYEDWDLWARCWQAGATIDAVPAAVYRAHVRRDSRNRGPAAAFKHATHQDIARANGLPVPA